MYLLDTNVVSEARRSQAAPQVLRWMRSARQHETYLSALVLGEVRTGIDRLRARDPRQAEVLERWIGDLRREFEPRIIPVDAEIAEEWGRMNAAGSMAIVDGLMAATAQVRGLVFVTRNVAHVARTGVRVLNPWEPPPA